MLRMTTRKLGAPLLVVMLLAAPAMGTPLDPEAAGGWWSTPVATTLEWLSQGLQHIGNRFTGSDAGEETTPLPEPTPTLEGADPNTDGSGDNSYPGLDPDG